MKLLSFLQKSEQESFWESVRKICFVIHDDYPLLFFSLMLRKIKTDCVFVEYIDIESQEQVRILSKLETTCFLNKKTVYWLGNLSQLSVKKKKFWLNYVHCYQGEYILCFCVNEQEKVNINKSDIQVDVDPMINNEVLEQLAYYLYQIKPTALRSICKWINSFDPVVALDKACLLLQYCLVLGNNVDSFCDEWLPTLLDPEHSLFKVSEYLLAKKSKEFWRLWAKVGFRYPAVFWVSFWSDLFWRAYHYVDTMHKNNYAEARKWRFKLPFTFLKWDWKEVKRQELKYAHAYLYDIDYNLKNGGDSYCLEILCLKFLQGQLVTQNVCNKSLKVLENQI